MAKLSRRAFNNILILFILCFIMLFNLPILHRDEPQSKQTQSKQNSDETIFLLPKSFTPNRIYFDFLILTNEEGSWNSNLPLSIPAKELALRWSTLSGTYVAKALLNKIKPNLNQPFALRIENSLTNQRYHLTYYQTPNFWLMQNWQEQWLAVSVEKQYLMPLNWQ